MVVSECKTEIMWIAKVNFPNNIALNDKTLLFWDQTVPLGIIIQNDLSWSCSN